MQRTDDGTEWERTGQRGAPSVIFIHGLGLNRGVWQWMAPALAQDYDLLSYDLYGHGGSAAPPETPSLRLFSRQLAALMDAAEIERAAIVGFSLGGMICRRFAQDAPDRARALVILNSPHRRTPDAQAAIVKRVDQAAAQGPSATVEAALERWFTDDYRARSPDMMALVRSWVMANDPEIYPTIYRVLAEGVDEIVAPVPPLTQPTLVLTGEEDWGNNPDMTHATANEINGAEALILPGLRHMALAEDPNAVNGAVRAFLDRTRTS
ncbi:MAG: alpha/beta hydrolase [Pseudomonadota bacterium]